MNDNEFLIELLAKLDEEASKGKINSDIETIRKNIKELQLQAKIDQASINKIVKQVESVLGKDITISNIKFDPKQVSQNVKRTAKEINNSFKSSINLDKIFDKKTNALMDEFGIKGKKAFTEIREALVKYRQEASSTTTVSENFDDLFDIFSTGNNDINKVTSAITNNMKVATNAKDVYADLVKYIQAVNKDGSKIHLPSTIKEEYGNMFNSMKKTLGSAFTLDGGTDFEVFLTELNKQLGNIIDLSKGAEYAFGDLIEKVISGRGTNFLSGNELFSSGILDRNDVEAKITDYMNSIEAEYQRITQVSNDSSNTIVQNEERKQKAYKETLDDIKSLNSETSIIRSGAGSITFDGTNNAAKEAQNYFNSILRDENAIISTVEKFGDNNALSSFTVNVKRASGEVESLKYSLIELKDDEGNVGETLFKLSESSIGDAGTKKLLQSIDNAFTDYTAKIAQFKNTNKEILSGLSDPLGEFESKLSGLKTGSATIDDVKNSFKILNAEASNITSNFTGQLNKIDAAVRNIAKGEETISGLRAEFKGLDNIPKNIDSELQKVSDALINIKKIESEEGRTANWAEAYREWEIVVDNLKAKLIALKKEQSNSASTQVYKTSDLRKNDIAYMTKLSNTINKQMAEIEKMAHAKGWTDFDVTGIEEADGKIKALVMTVTDAEGAIKKLNFQRAKLVGNGKVQDGLMQTGDVQILKTATKAQEDLAVKTQKANIELANQLQRIQGLSNGTIKNDYSSQIAKLEGNFRNLGFTAEEVKEKTSNVASAFEALKIRVNQPFDESNYQEIISLNDALQKELAESNNEYTKLSASVKGYVSVQQRLSKANVIEAWNQKNSGASQDVLKANEAYVASLRNLNSQMSKMQFNEITDGFKRTENSMRGIGKLGISVKEQFAQATKSFTQLFSIGSIVATVINQLRKVPQAVYEIDTAMTNLYKVTDETESKYASFLNSASDSANKLGRSMSGLIEQTANWAKLGFSLDESSKLAKISSIYANVGEVDDSTAVSDIVTAMKAFNIEAENSITIVDSLNKLGNEFSTDAKSLGEGLRNSASSMAVAGNDINQTLAILTGGGEITQNISELSNGLRVISMRLRGMKGELQEIGEEYEDIESISKIQTQIYDLTKGSVNIFNDDGSFKSTYEQLKEISEIYFDLSDSDRADLTEILFGKNRANQGIAILQAFQSGQIQKAYEASVNSAGSAYEEQSRWLESLEAKTQQFEAAFQSLSNTVIDSNIVKEFVDLGTSGVSALDGIVKVLGNINSLGGNISSIFGTIGAASGLLMNKNGIGERTMFQWRIVHAPTPLKLCNNAI